MIQKYIFLTHLRVKDFFYILEYASIIWSPFSKVSKFRSLIDQIERVQRLFTRRLITICVGYTNSYDINYKLYIERLVYFKLESLELRRLKIDLTTIFKISNNYTDINISDILNISNNCRTRGNCKKLNVIHNSDNTITNLINNRSVNIWNSLNNDIIKSISVSSFKNKINKICFDKQLFFNRNFKFYIDLCFILYLNYCIISSGFFLMCFL